MVELDKNKVLELVRHDDVAGVLDIVKKADRMVDFDLCVEGVSLLEEVRSLEMLVILSRCGGYIYRRNSKNKTPIHGMKKNLKMLLKEKRQERLKEVSDLKKLKTLTKQTKKMSDAIRLFKLINYYESRGVFGCYSYFGMIAEILGVFDGQPLQIEKMNKNDFFKTAATYIDKEWANYFVRKVRWINWLMKEGEYDYKETQKNRELITSSAKLKSLFLLDQKKEPVMFYRGTVWKNDPFLPLSHFGTKRAAFERLRNLMRAYDEDYNGVDSVLDGKEINDRIYVAFLKMKHPLRIADLDVHNPKTYASAVLHYLLVKKYGVSYLEQLYNIPIEKNNKRDVFEQREYINKTLSKMDFSRIVSAQALPKEFDFIFYEPKRMDIKAVRKELFLGGMYPFISSKKNKQAEQQNRENLVYQRMIRFFQKEGYDGFIYKNETEDRGKDSFIIFHPKQVVVTSRASKEELYQEIINPHEEMLQKLERIHLSDCEEKILTLEEARELQNYSIYKTDRAEKSKISQQSISPCQLNNQHQKA